jgi:M6 family metalloprotease-like protein
VVVCLCLISVKVSIVYAHNTGITHAHSTVSPSPSPSINTSELQSLNQELIDSTKEPGFFSRLFRIAPSRRSDYEPIAQKRKEIMKELAEEQPEAFLQFAIPEETRAKLPANVQPLVEQKVYVSGTVMVMHVDDFKNPANSEFRYTLITGVSTLDLRPVSMLAVSSQAQIGVSGYALDSTLVSSANEATLQVLAAAPQPDSLGNQRTAFILVDFLDSITRPFTPTQLKRWVFEGEFQKFFKEQSYNQISFSGDVYGWYKLPRNARTTGWHPECGQLSGTEIRKLITDNNINFSNYDRVVIVPSHPLLSLGCSGVGKGTYIDGTVYSPSVSWVAAEPLIEVTEHEDYVQTFSTFDSVLSHEMGHGLGLQHANAWGCENGVLYGKCEHVEYGNTYDAMGFAGYAYHFNAMYKELLGWIKPENSLTISSSGRYTINPLELSGGKQIAKIKGLGSNETPFYLEYRKAIGFDHALSQPIVTNTQKGLLINHKIGNGEGRFSRLLDMTPPFFSNDPMVSLNGSNVFNDPGRGIAVGPIVAVGTSSITFDVKIAQPVCMRANPVFYTVDYGTIFAGKNNYIGIGITNNDSFLCAPSQFTYTATLPAGWTYTTNPSPELISGNGGSTYGSLTLIPSQNAQGSYLISLTLTNKQSGLKTVKEMDILVAKPHSITSISPTIASIGDIVTITGKGFDVGTVSVNIMQAGSTLSYPVITSQTPTSVKFEVPTVASGVYDIAAQINSVDSNTVKLQIDSGTEPRITIAPRPQLKLEYDAAGKESALVSTFNVTVDARQKDLFIPKNNGFIIRGSNTTNNYISFQSSAKTTSSTVINNPDFFVIPKGKQAVLVVTGRAVNLKQMFAGTYTAELAEIIMSQDYQYRAQAVSDKTNAVTIIGEVSPYITSINTPVATNQNLVINGVRFGTTDTTNNVVLENVDTRTRVEIPIASVNGTKITIPIESYSNMRTGRYYLSVLHPTTGSSNQLSLQIIQATSTPTTTPQSVISFTLINTDTDQPISGYENMRSTTTLNLTTLPTRNFTIRVNTKPSRVGSIKFSVPGDIPNNNRIENGAPYSLTGDTSGDYFKWNIRTGSFTVTATPYSQIDAGGIKGMPLSVLFRITDPVLVAPHSIFVSSNVGGNIYPSGVISVVPGSTQTFSIVPNPGFYGHVFVDGQYIGSDSILTIRDMEDKDYSVTVQFFPTIAPTQNPTPSPTTSLTPSPSVTSTPSISPSTSPKPSPSTSVSPSTSPSASPSSTAAPAPAAQSLFKSILKLFGF